MVLHTVEALQETKWFGKEVYLVSKQQGGHPPGCTEQTEGEGVAVVLSGSAVTHPKDRGQQWKAWRAGLVKATLATGTKNKFVIKGKTLL